MAPMTDLKMSRHEKRRPIREITLSYSFNLRRTVAKAPTNPVPNNSSEFGSA